MGYPMRYEKKIAVVTATVQRPNDTTQYTANDAVSDSTSSPTAITFANCARVGTGTGWIVNAWCIDSANQSTLPSLELYLFDTAPTPTNDNAEFGLTDAEAKTCLGILKFDSFDDLDPTSGTNGNAMGTPSNMDRPIGFVCGTDLRDLYGLVKVVNAYTPVAQEQFTFRLQIEQD